MQGAGATSETQAREDSGGRFAHVCARSCSCRLPMRARGGPLQQFSWLALASAAGCPLGRLVARSGWVAKHSAAADCREFIEWGEERGETESVMVRATLARSCVQSMARRWPEGGVMTYAHSLHRDLWR